MTAPVSVPAVRHRRAAGRSRVPALPAVLLVLLSLVSLLAVTAGAAASPAAGPRVPAQAPLDAGGQGGQAEEAETQASAARAGRVRSGAGYPARRRALPARRARRTPVPGRCAAPSAAARTAARAVCWTVLRC
ncbi:hypothetical protein ACFU9F_08580 [Streptomyces zhihengii]|uniref:hypothetical protein n=1 Tax=Streptomyces zhihengii TaxID=1818004 RepID=UPI0036B3D521